MPISMPMNTVTKRTNISLLNISSFEHSHNNKEPNKGGAR